MLRINCIATVCLGIAALLAWSWVCFKAVTFQTQASYSLHTYPSFFATALTLCACLGWVLVTWQSARGDGETRCRKCRHILRGLSQPVCPECGTPI